MKVGVSSYSYMQYIRAGKMTQLDTVAKAKEMGFDAIEFINIAGETLEEQKAYAQKIAEEAARVGIDIIAYTVSAHLFYDTPEKNEEEVERLKGQLDIAKILGAKVFRHDTCRRLEKSGAGKSFDLMLPTIAANIKKLTEYGQSLGIRTCSENHGRVSQDSDRMERLFNAVDHDNFGLLLDLGNFYGVDEYPAHAVSRLAPYAIHVHVKDVVIRETPVERYENFSRGGQDQKSVIIGDGDVPVERCIRILKNAGYDGYLSIEFEAEGDCIEGIAKGLQSLKKFIANVEA